MTDLLIKRSAIISDCGLYRYRLERGLIASASLHLRSRADG